MTTEFPIDWDTLSPQLALACRRLIAVGIDPTQVPRYGGIDLDGYLTVSKPIRVLRNYRVATNRHAWHIPAQTVAGIVAAVKAADRAERR